jgi:hypothetical protein
LYGKAWDEAIEEPVQRSLLKGLCTVLSGHASSGKVLQSIQLPKAAVESAEMNSYLWDLAKEEGNLVAITLGGIATAAAVTTTTKDEEEDASSANHHQYHTRGEWLDCFLQQTFGTKVCTPFEMNTCCEGLVASLSQDEWNDLVAPAVAKKLKATPEKVLETCEAFDC